MNLIYDLLKIDKNTRQGVISATSALNVAVNLVVALFKIVVGALASSIAIISEGVLNILNKLLNASLAFGSSAKSIRL